MREIRDSVLPRGEAKGTKQGEVVLGGIITSLRRRVTKKGKMMAFVTLEDLTGVVETMVLPETYERCGGVTGGRARSW